MLRTHMRTRTGLTFAHRVRQLLALVDLDSRCVQSHAPMTGSMSPAYTAQIRLGVGMAVAMRLEAPDGQLAADAAQLTASPLLCCTEGLRARQAGVGAPVVPRCAAAMVEQKRASGRLDVLSTHSRRAFSGEVASSLLPGFDTSLHLINTLTLCTWPCSPMRAPASRTLPWASTWAVDGRAPLASHFDTPHAAELRPL